MGENKQALHVVVIGAGIVGACCALELLREGHRVTMIDPGEPGGEQAASYGNGAWLSPSSVVPMSMPGLWRKIPGYLMNQSSPLTIRWAALASLAPWLWRFLWAGNTVAKVERTASALSAILRDAPARHQAIAQEIGRPELIQKNGLFYPYPTRAAFEAEALAWRLRSDNGVEWKVFEGEALKQFMPALGAHYQFGVWVPAGGNCINPGAYVAAIVAYCCKLGASLVRERATGFAFSQSDRHLVAVQTGHTKIACERAVIAAGIASRGLAQKAGDRVFLESERGYHVVFEQPGFEMPIPAMPSDAKMAITSTQTGFRVSGQVELASTDAAPNWQRAEILRKHALANFPGLRKNAAHLASVSLQASAPQGLRRWMGHRPSTPDGLPVISPSNASPDIFHAYGHGHVGLASAAVTGRLIAELIGQKPSSMPLAPYSIRRYR